MANDAYTRTAVGGLKDIIKRITLLERSMAKQGTRPVPAVLDPAYVGREARGLARVKFLDGDMSMSELSDPMPWASPYEPSAARTVKVYGGTILGQDPNIDGTLVGEYPVEALNNFWPNDEYTNQCTYGPAPKVTALVSGRVILSGMLRKIGATVNTEPVLTFPEELAPDVDVIVPVMVGGEARTATIYRDGTMGPRGSWGSDTWVSLEGVGWWRKGIAQWTPIGAAGSTDPVRFATGFASNPGWEPPHGVPSYWLDPYGFLWFQGLSMLTANMSADNTSMIVLPPELRGDLEQHILAAGNEVFSYVGTQTTNGLNWKANSVSSSGSWITLGTVCITTTAAMTLNNWQSINFALPNWNTKYGTNFPQARFLRREDGLAMSRGLVQGQVGSNAFRALRECQPRDHRSIMNRVSGGRRARIDLNSAMLDGLEGAGLVYGNSGDQWTGLSWVTLDGMNWIP